MPKINISRNLWAAGLWLSSLVLFYSPLANLLSLAVNDDRYSYTLLVPVISGFLLWLKKEEIQKSARFSPALGSPLLLAGTIIGTIPANLSIAMFGIWVFWLGIPLSCYGVKALRAIPFPALFLLLVIPAPSSAMEQLVRMMQSASADVTAGLFRLTGISFERDGFVFGLGKLDIEIAEECSGIRSATAMFISAILASHLMLQNRWSRIGFALLSIPVVIFKNAVRITGITWLGLNVDEGFFVGDLHKYSGMPFSVVALALLLPALWALRRVENQTT